MGLNSQQALANLVNGRSLSHHHMTELMHNIMRGEVAPELLSAILVALRLKGETVEEIVAAAQVMKVFASKVVVPRLRSLVDIVGTGGDGEKTFNISTASMFVAAAAGAKVAKHGGRAVSSSSGSADVLAELGMPLTMWPEHIVQCIDYCNIGFMFAPNHHGAMRHVAPIRKALGIRTIFNILGPLTNPANASNQLIGVYDPDLTLTMVRVAKQLGAKHVLSICGEGGLDEITITGPTQIAELKKGEITEYEISPRDFDMHIYPNLDDIRVETVAESVQMIRDVLDGKKGPARDIVLLNAAACLYAGNKATSLKSALGMARRAIDNGSAKEKLATFIEVSQQLVSV